MSSSSFYAYCWLRPTFDYVFVLPFPAMVCPQVFGHDRIVNLRQQFFLPDCKRRLFPEPKFAWIPPHDRISGILILTILREYVFSGPNRLHVERLVCWAA